MYTYVVLLIWRMVIGYERVWKDAGCFVFDFFLPSSDWLTVVFAVVGTGKVQDLFEPHGINQFVRHMIDGKNINQC